MLRTHMVSMWVRNGPNMGTNMGTNCYTAVSCGAHDTPNRGHLGVRNPRSTHFGSRYSYVVWAIASYGLLV